MFGRAIVFDLTLSSATAGDLRPGDRVLVRGLKIRADLNGRLATVQSKMSGERVAVLIDDEAGVKALKPTNLENFGDREKLAASVKNLGGLANVEEARSRAEAEAAAGGPARNIDVWREYAVAKRAAGEPFWSTGMRIPAPSFEVSQASRVASAGPPSSANPFDNKAAFATAEKIAEWTQRKEAADAHLSAKEYELAFKVSTGTLDELDSMHHSRAHPDDTELIKLYSDLLGSSVEALLSVGSHGDQEAAAEWALELMSKALMFDIEHAKNRVRFARLQLAIPGRVLTNQLIQHCLYSLDEEKGRESEQIKSLIHECRRRLENLHGNQLGMIKGAGATELMVPQMLANGTRFWAKHEGPVQLGNSPSGCFVLHARFALGVALEMDRSEPEIARRAEDLRQAESLVETMLNAPPLAWDLPAAYAMDDVNKTQFYPGFLSSENCGPYHLDASGVLM